MFCANCGGEYPAQSRFCPFCGNPLRRGENAAERIIEAERLVLKDTAGKVRAELAICNAEPRLALFDSIQRPRVFIRVAADGPDIELIGSNGKCRLQLELFEDVPAVSLSDADGKVRAVLQVRQYFTFNPVESIVSAEFKARMAPAGTFYPISCSLYKFPSVAAALLKYKKHEWIIIAFERAKQVERVWVNKGVDRTRVVLALPIAVTTAYCRARPTWSRQQNGDRD